METINVELSVNYVTKLATVPRYVVHDHHQASHLKLITWLVIKLETIALRWLTQVPLTTSLLIFKISHYTLNMVVMRTL